jgi:hypothetical protein
MLAERCEERRLQPRTFVNRLIEQPKEHATLLPVDPQRRLLETRIEHAKERLADDLDRAVSLARQATTTVRRGLARVALMGGLLLAGALVALVQRRRRRHQLRFTWK